MAQTLSEIVLQDGLASPEQVASAAQVAEAESVPLVVPLIRQVGIDDLALVKALAKATRIPVADLSKLEVDLEAIRRLPKEMCSRLRVLPLSLDAYVDRPDALRLAMADPTDSVAVAEVEHHSGCRVESAVVPLSSLEELIEAQYKLLVTEVMSRSEASAQRSRVPSFTVPFHRVSDEATLEIRHRALLKVLLNRGIFTEDEYEEEIRLFLKQALT
jgi:hypothetical protein